MSSRPAGNFASGSRHQPAATGSGSRDNRQALSTANTPIRGHTNASESGHRHSSPFGARALPSHNVRAVNQTSQSHSSESAEVSEEHDDEDSGQEDQGSSPAPSPDADEEDDEDDDEEEEEEEVVDEDDESPFKFLQNFDPNLFGAFDASWPSQGSQQLPQSGATPSARHASGVNQPLPSSSNDAEFYSNMIQVLTHVLGSSNPVPWHNQATPGSQLAPSPFTLPQSSPAPTPGQTPIPRHVSSSHQRSTKSQRQPGFSDLQPLIHSLISRLGGDHHSPRHPVREQDLTALLQSLMEQQQRQQVNPAFQQQDIGNTDLLPTNANDDGRSRPSTSRQSFAQDAMQPMHFADLVFEDEDEDDPDFNPDMNPNLPLPSAWSLAVQDVVGSKESRAAAAAVAASSSANTPAARTPVGSRFPEVEITQPSVHSSLESSRRGSYTNANKRQRTEHSDEDDFRPNDLEPPPVFPLSPSGRPVRSTRLRPQSPAEATGKGSQARSQTSQARVTSRSPSANEASGIPASRASQNAEPSHEDGRRSPSTAAAGEGNGPRKRGRKPYLDAEEAQRRRAERNIEYQRQRRQMKRVENIEQSETVMELRAEVKMLRAELSRLRDENATLRAQRELGEMQRSGQYRDNRHRDESSAASPWSILDSPEREPHPGHRQSSSADRHHAASWQIPPSSDRRRSGIRQAPTPSATGVAYRTRGDRFA